MNLMVIIMMMMMTLFLVCLIYNTMYWEQCSIARVARTASFISYYDVKH